MVRFEHRRNTSFILEHVTGLTIISSLCFQGFYAFCCVLKFISYSPINDVLRSFLGSLSFCEYIYIYGIRIKNYVINKMYLFLNYSGVYLNKDF